MKRRKNKQLEEVDKNRWIISYADFITLLFAFFVVMYSVSSVSESKYKSLSEGLHSAFNLKDKEKATQSTADLKSGPESKNTKGNYKDGMDHLKKSLSEIEDGSYKVIKEKGWIELDVRAGALFKSGDVSVTPEGMLKLMKIAEKVKEFPFTIVVEGYTDDSPIQTPQYPSNWELSAARAATVGRVLNNFGIQKDHILVIGYGEQFPVADNLTEEGRSENRRVCIIIAKDKSVSRLLNPQQGQIHAGFMSVDPEQSDDPKKVNKDAQKEKK